MMKRLETINYGKLWKIALGSGLAILTANMMGLLYSPSAGIITLLSIQNTKRETIAIAGRRILSFLLAFALAWLCFGLFGYTPLVFGLFLFLFVWISELAYLQDGISMNAVLTTHFLIEKHMSWSLIQNELLLLCIGMGIGIALNLMIRTKTKELKQQLFALDDSMRQQLLQLAHAVRKKTSALDLEGMQLILNRAIAVANTDRNNQLLADYSYFIKYCTMRKAQVQVLIALEQLLPLLTKEMPQAMLLATFIEQIAASYQEYNEVEDLLQQFQKLLRQFQNSELPATRDEFEQRAILFQILLQLKQFLDIKREFVMQLTSEERSRFWNA